LDYSTPKKLELRFFRVEENPQPNLFGCFLGCCGGFCLKVEGSEWGDRKRLEENHKTQRAVKMQEVLRK
jgi:hypothetical protein